MMNHVEISRDTFLERGYFLYLTLKTKFSLEICHGNPELSEPPGWFRTCFCWTTAVPHSSQFSSVVLLCFQGFIWGLNHQVLHSVCGGGLRLPAFQRNHLQRPQTREPYTGPQGLCQTGKTAIRHYHPTTLSIFCVFWKSQMLQTRDTSSFYEAKIYYQWNMNTCLMSALIIVWRKV